MKLLLPALLAPALAACAATTPAPPADALRAPQGLTPEQVVAARQSAFHLSAVAFGGMRAAVESGGDVKGAAFSARGLARWAEVLPTMFPDGTRLEGSRALPSVWQDRPGFDARAADFRSATARLSAAAQAGDKAAFADAYKAVGQACSSCHTPYRAEPPR